MGEDHILLGNFWFHTPQFHRVQPRSNRKLKLLKPGVEATTTEVFYGHGFKTSFFKLTAGLKRFIQISYIGSKSLYRSRAGRHFHGTENEIWAGWQCWKKIGTIMGFWGRFFYVFRGIFFFQKYLQIWPALSANFLTLQVWEGTGAIQDDKYLKWQ